MIKIIPSLFIFLSFNFAHSAMEYITSKSCIEELKLLSDDTTQYNFTRKGPRGSYDIIEIPAYAGSERYTTVYNSEGYTEINSESGSCNFHKKDAAKNSDVKMLELFKKRLSQVEKLKLQSTNPFYGAVLFDFALDNFKRNCAADFNNIQEYLEKNNLLPATLKAPAYVDPICPRPEGCSLEANPSPGEQSK